MLWLLFFVFFLNLYVDTNLTWQPKSQMSSLDYHLNKLSKSWVPDAVIRRFNLKAFLVPEKKIFKCLLSNMGMAAILFNGVFE